ncbi:MAG: PilZ domain-containing protein [Bdellovibrionales bacterium]|nr:PilZ domain-containing protein [Bdellovibrionales bacterium]
MNEMFGGGPMGIQGSDSKRPKQIVLASRTEQENAILRKKLQGLTAFGEDAIRVATTRPQATKLELAGDPDLVIFNFNEWNRNELQWVEELRNEGYRNMIMILAKAEAPRAVQNLKLLERVVYLEKPYEIRDLVGITEKALHQGEVAQRIHRRFNTEQAAQLEFETEVGRSVASRVFNLSLTGAYLELNALRDVKVGEFVRLRLDLDDMNRTYVMPARIVWTNILGRTGGTGVGLHFTGRGAVKRHIVQL